MSVFRSFWQWSEGWGQGRAELHICNPSFLEGPSSSVSHRPLKCSSWRSKRLCPLSLVITPTSHLDSSFSRFLFHPCPSGHRILEYLPSTSPICSLFTPTSGDLTQTCIISPIGFLTDLSTSAPPICVNGKFNYVILLVISFQGFT